MLLAASQHRDSLFPSVFRCYQGVREVQQQASSISILLALRLDGTAVKLSCSLAVPKDLVPQTDIIMCELRSLHAAGLRHIESVSRVAVMFTFASGLRSAKPWHNRLRCSEDRRNWKDVPLSYVDFHSLDDPSGERMSVRFACINGFWGRPKLCHYNT